MQENPNPRPPEEPSPGQPEAGRKRAFSPVFFGFALAILILSGLLFWGSALLRPSGPDPVSAPPANNRPVSSSSSVSAEESAPPAARRGNSPCSPRGGRAPTKYMTSMSRPSRKKSRIACGRVLP